VACSRQSANEQIIKTTRGWRPDEGDGRARQLIVIRANRPHVYMLARLASIEKAKQTRALTSARARLTAVPDYDW